MNRPGLIVFFHSVSQLEKLIKGLSSVCLVQLLLVEAPKIKHTSFNSFFPKGRTNALSIPFHLKIFVEIERRRVFPLTDRAHYAKSYAYINNMPWGHVNDQYKGPRWAHPFHSTLGRHLDQIQQPALPPREESGQLFGAHPPGSSSGLGSSQARAIPHTLFTFHE